MLARSRKVGAALLLAACAEVPQGTPASAASDTPAGLAERHRLWLEEVAVLVSKQERRAFLRLKQDYQRDGFVRRWWEARDPYPETERNEFQIEWRRRVETAREEFGSLTEDRSLVYLLHGPAARVRETDCLMLLWPLEVWTYEGGGSLPRGFVVIFYQTAAGGPFRRWRRSDGFRVLQAIYQETADLVNDDYMAFRQDIFRYCPVLNEELMLAVDGVIRQEGLAANGLVERAPPVRDTEWLQTFAGFSTDLPPGASPLEAALEVAFGGANQSRTVVQTALLVPKAAATAGDLEGHLVYGFLLTGEVLRDQELFESFRYRFDVPAENVGGTAIPLAFERALRPGAYSLVLRLEDLHSGRQFRIEHALEVPAASAAARDLPRSTLLTLLTAPPAEALPVRLVPPPDGLLVGALRVEARVGEGARRVTFALDGKDMLTRNGAPWAIDLLLGPVPRPRTVTAIAYDASGVELGRDELALNQPPQRFAVMLLEPRDGGQYQGLVQVRAEVRVPDDRHLERLELYLGEQRLAVLEGPPFAVKVSLPAGGGAAIVRAVGFLDDGHSAEDVALINSAERSERLQVRLVELYAAVRDRQRRPVLGLERRAFQVLEDGEPQELLRFEPVADLPLQVAMVVDTSASMAPRLEEVQRAALGFVRRALRPKDRAALVTFADTPNLVVPLTGDADALSAGLARLTAERSTALWDTLVYTLSYLQGASGQSAIFLLTDGDDRSSHYGFDEALETARRSGITIYVLGVKVPRLDLQARTRLERLAQDTGGRSFFVDDAGALGPVYTAIEEELRSRYLLVYQPEHAGGNEFRAVEVRVEGGLEVQAPRGYYP